jgi:hypothetical protein
MLEQMNIDDDWDNFLSTNELSEKKTELSKITEMPKSSNLYISTKTIIAYLNCNFIDIHKIFWKIPIISYSTQKEGIIKKQIKFSTNDKKELEKVQEKIKDQPYSEVQIIEHIDTPDGRIKFKDQRKISIGLCKKDIISQRSKKKRAFFNCFVLIFRIIDNTKNIFKEMHVKVFNTGKIEIPGVQDDNTMNLIINRLILIMQPFIDEPLSYDMKENNTVLINSNYNCGYYINRDILHNILKYEYRINSSYDSCSYPGIQSKFHYIPGISNELQTGSQPENSIKTIEISFMIFRTGSILIVGKCEQNILEFIYEKIKSILNENYYRITMGIIDKPLINIKPKIIKKNVKTINI